MDYTNLFSLLNEEALLRSWHLLAYAYCLLLAAAALLLALCGLFRMFRAEARRFRA